MNIPEIIHLNVTNETADIPMAGVFLAIGHDPSTQLVADQLELDSAGYIVLHDRSQETSVSGVFAAGDVEDHVYRQAGVAAGSGIKAALDAIGFLNDIGLNENVVEQLKNNRFRIAEGNMIGEITQITNMDEFNSVMTDSSGVVIIDFWAEYCPSCMQMLPVFEAVASEFTGKVAFAKVDAEKATDVIEKLFVHKVPCLMVFKDGQLIARYNGVMSKKELKVFIDQFIQ